MSQLPDHEESLVICYYALENISWKLLATLRGMEFLRLADNRFAALLYLDGQELEPRFLAGLERIAEIMSKEFSIDTTICLGDVANSWENINISYEQTRIALDSHSTSHYGVAKAAELLASTDLLVAAVSQQVGITNTNYFYSLFRACSHKRSHASFEELFVISCVKNS